MCLPACKKKGPGGPAALRDDPAAKQARENAKACEDALREPGVAEARAWCAPTQTSHIGFEVSRDGMLQMTNDLYAAGATKVSVVGIEKMGEREISAALAVQLPTDTLKRKDVFAAETKIRYGEDGPGEGDEITVDVGQACLFLALD